jgi:hypothetical protein
MHGAVSFYRARLIHQNREKWVATMHPNANQSVKSEVVQCSPRCGPVCSLHRQTGLVESDGEVDTQLINEFPTNKTAGGTRQHTYISNQSTPILP